MSKSEKVPVRSLAKLFASKLSDNEWLKQQLSKISIPIPEDTVEDCVAMPDYCPKLNTLYDLILSVRLSVTFFITSLCFHKKKIVAIFHRSRIKLIQNSSNFSKHFLRTAYFKFYSEFRLESRSMCIKSVRRDFVMVKIIRILLQRLDQCWRS